MKPKEIVGRYESPQRCPRPREARLLNALISGEAKSVSQALKIAGFHEASRSLRERLQPDGDLRNTLDKVLTDAGINPQVIAQNTRALMDAKKTLITKNDAILVDDNDVRLRSNELGIKLLERAGSIPKAPEGSSGATNIQVNILTLTDGNDNQ